LCTKPSKWHLTGLAETSFLLMLSITSNELLPFALDGGGWCLCGPEKLLKILLRKIERYVNYGGMVIAGADCGGRSKMLQNCGRAENTFKYIKIDNKQIIFPIF
jgi:hypothetical protein